MDGFASPLCNIPCNTPGARRYLRHGTGRLDGVERSGSLLGLLTSRLLRKMLRFVVPGPGKEPAVGRVMAQPPS
jgi:hypothetical protein